MGTELVRPDGAGFCLFEDADAVAAELDAALRRIARPDAEVGSEQPLDDDFEFEVDVSDIEIEGTVRSLAEETLATLQLGVPKLRSERAELASEQGVTWEEWSALHPQPKEREPRARVAARSLGVAGFILALSAGGYFVGTIAGRMRAADAVAASQPTPGTAALAGDPAPSQVAQDAVRGERAGVIPTAPEGASQIGAGSARTSTPSAATAPTAEATPTAATARRDAPLERTARRRDASAPHTVASTAAISRPAAVEGSSDARSSSDRREAHLARAEATADPVTDAAPAADEDEAVDPAYAKMFEDEDEGDDAAPAEISRKLYIPPNPTDALPEGVTRDDIMRVVLENKDGLAECAIEHAAGEHGELRVQWSMALDGTVSHVETTTAALKGSPFAGCIEAQVRQFAFPAHRVEQPTVTFPFRY